MPGERENWNILIIDYLFIVFRTIIFWIFSKKLTNSGSEYFIK